jgi:hypothetical protein
MLLIVNEYQFQNYHLFRGSVKICNTIHLLEGTTSKKWWFPFCCLIGILRSKSHI